MFKLIFSVLALATNAAELRTVEDKIPGEYIVVMKPNATLTTMDFHLQTTSSKCQQKKAMYEVEHEYRFLGEFKGYGAKLDEAALADILADDAVDYVEENARVYASQTCVRQTTNDWGLTRIPQISRVASTAYDYIARNEAGVTVYIVDSGIRRDHVDFEGRALFGTDTTTATPPRTDQNGHGTHVAGTVGGRLYGVAKTVRLVDVRVLDARGSGSTTGIVNGINWLANNCRAGGRTCIANLSLGGPAATATDNAVNAAHANGVLMIVASGNDGQNACNVSPARATQAFTVNAADVNDNRATFSNWGACTNLYAPGVNIRSAWHTSTTAVNTISGTSMASPHVAGVAARLLAANPALTPNDLRNQIIQRMSGNVVRNNPTQTPNQYVRLTC